MINRRRTGSTSAPAPVVTNTVSPTNPNPGYVPLHSRPSNFAYNSPTASTAGGMSMGGTGMGGNGYFGLGFEGEAVHEGSTPKDIALRAVKHIQAGVRDAVRVDRSWGLVWGDTELRSRVLKLTVINLLALVLLSLFPLVLSPLTHGGLSDNNAAKVSWWYNVLLSWPTFAVVFWMNSLWGPDVAKRAQTLLHPAYRHQPTSSTASAIPSFSDDPGLWTWNLVTRLLLIADFTLVYRLLAGVVPIIGWPIGLAYMCLINSYYAYEWIFVSRGWPLDYRCAYVTDRAAFMFGFGLPATLLTTFGPPMVNMAIFTLIYPLLLIQALQSRPPVTHTLLPSEPDSDPTTPTSSSGMGPDLLGAPTKSAPTGAMAYARVPVFFLARHALNGVDFLVSAVMRQRGGYAARRRGSKRAF